MNIITNRKVITTSNFNEYSSLDGKSTSTQVLAFQKWMNKVHPELGGNIKEDGIFKANDEYYYSTYGTQYEKAAAALSNTLSDAFGVGTKVNPIGSKEGDKGFIKGALTATSDWGKNYVSPNQKSANAKAKADADTKSKEKTPDKLTNLQIGLIIGGSVLGLTIIGILIAKSSN
jgi:hypothetical protein